MEQDQKVRDLEQVEAWVGLVVAVAREVVAVAREVVLRQVRAVLASAPTVGKGSPINWGPPVMSRNALSAKRP